MNKNKIDEESTLDLAMIISKQKTICEISTTGFQIGVGKVIDFIMHKWEEPQKSSKKIFKILDTTIK